MKAKSLSIGVDTSIKNFKYILNKYQKYINSIYFGIPNFLLDRQFTGRAPIYYKTQNYQQQNEIINYARSLGIKLVLTLNKIPSYSNDFNTIYHQLKTFVFKYIDSIQPNEICTLDNMVKPLQSMYPDLKYCRSFHEGLPTQEILDANIYDIYVIRNSYAYLKSKLIKNKENRLVLNTSCFFDCPGCRYIDVPIKDFQTTKNYHINMFDKEFNTKCNNILEKYLAYYCWFGKDLVQFEKSFSTNIISYKFANRGNSYTVERLEFIIDNYINEGTITPEALEIKNNYAPIIDMCSNGGFIDRYMKYKLSSKSFNYELFEEYKNEYWTSIVNKTII